jgi:ribosomal protein S6
MVIIYDLMVLTAPQAAAEGKEKFKDNVEALLTKQKAKVLACDEWGERGLSYPISKHDRGMYYVYAIEMESDKASLLNTKLKLEKGVLRYLLVKRVGEKKLNKVA